MVEEKFTRCPGCSTIFRVTPPQLALRGGQVRCGHCHTVFNGVAALVSLAPELRPQRKDADFDDPALGPPTVTLRSAQALEPAPDIDERIEPAIIAPIRRESTADELESDYASRFSWQEKRERRSVPSWIFGMSVPVLVLLFAGQGLFHFRDAIAAHWPNTKPALIRLCAAAGCQVHALRDVAALSIEASDLQADPAHKGLLILSATIRNRAPYPLAYPYIELTLSDAQDQPVVRRAFAPGEYISGATDPETGIVGNTELPVKLFIDASATTQAGYQVYLFYP
jgi:predicted Zn finger-like uncharacterized protein